MYLHDPLVDLPRPSAEDPPLEFLRSGAENPPSDISRPGAEQIFLLYIEEKFSALVRGESTFGSIAPGRGTDFLLYIEERIFCARARRIHLWIYRAQARNGFPSLYRGENFLRSGAENPPLDLPRPGAERISISIYWRRNSALGRGESTFGSIAPGRGTDFLLNIEEKIFCARARRIHLWIYRARARNEFSSLYRGENFLRPVAENPRFFSIWRRK